MFNRDACETAVALALIQTSSFVFFPRPTYSLEPDIIIKKKHKERGPRVVPTALKWLHREQGGGRNGNFKSGS